MCRRPDQSGFPVHPADPTHQEVCFLHHDPAGLAEEPFLVLGVDDDFVDPAQEAVEPSQGGRLSLSLLPVGNFFLELRHRFLQFRRALLHPLFEFLIQPAQRLLGQLAVGDVPGHVDAAHGAAFCKKKGRDGHQEIPAQFVDLGGMGLPILQQLAVGARVRRLLQTVYCLIAGASHQLLWLQPQGLGHGAVAPDYPVLLVQDDNEVGHGVEGALPFLLGPAHRRLGPLALGDVCVGAEPLNDPPVGIIHRHHHVRN